ncbi:chorismate synthase [Salinisphaera sp.]|uniref:chorismate synthase n=1 Tax=Salinisphaera sp. TaxID=1914330 RepID=UPI002D76D456|nr:chorismate synthase [Salinisphaera sp.]HET7315297.1 chorismate synthase [Salinisphaera sp.]
MAGNTWGRHFTVTSFGESHGPAIGCVVDGCPPGVAIDEALLQRDLDRRKPGTSRYVTQRREADEARIVSGVFEGVTTGTPIAIVIENTDQRSRDYSKIKDVFRPNHADYAYLQKYGIRDYRGGGRSSARETAVRVAAGAIARKILAERWGIGIAGYLAQMGEIKLACTDLTAADDNPFFCAEPARVAELEAYINQLRRDGDSVGARIDVIATGVPVGWGEPVFDRLDADIAKALMSINAVKGVEIGDGFDVVAMRGSEHRDEMGPGGFASNHSGGIQGGISTGQAIRASMALKPTSSITIPGNTVDTAGQATPMRTTGRHDPCVGLRATPIAEAMLGLTLLDHALRHRGQNADVTPPMTPLAGDPLF